MSRLLSPQPPSGSKGERRVQSPPKEAEKAQRKAKQLAARNMKKEAAAGFSPGTMRKAQKAGMGQNASLGMVEDAIRAVEGSVVNDLSQDAALRKRVQKVHATSTDAVFEQAKMEKRLEQLGERLKAVRTSGEIPPDLEKSVTKAEVKHSTLVARACVMLDDTDKEQLVANLEEAQRIVQSLDGVGSKRNHILLHCLNGLANAKVATACGEGERKEVLAQLFGLLIEDQTLEIPHNNSRVRLNHCLKICERIIARAIDIEEVKQLEDVVVDLERKSASVSPASASSAGPSPVQPPPITDED